MSEPLTQLEGRVYHYLIDFLAENTFQPSIREIARRFRIKSTKTISDVLSALEVKGYIERDEVRSRGVRLLGVAASGSTQPVPCYTCLSAGEPALVSENRHAFITMDRRFLPSEDVYMLRMKGESMSERGILDGDYVMISSSTRAKDGDIVAARLGDDSAVKTLTHHGSVVLLEPPDDGERPIQVGRQDDFAILGVVCGVFRPFCERGSQLIEGEEIQLR